MRISPLYGTSQQYVPLTLRASIMPLCYHSLMSRHLGERQRSESMQRKFYLPHISENLYITVCDCQSYARNRRTTMWQRIISLFSATEPSEFVAIDISWSFRKMGTGNQFIVVMTEKSLGPTKATPITKAQEAQWKRSSATTKWQTW